MVNNPAKALFVFLKSVIIAALLVHTDVSSAENKIAGNQPSDNQIIAWLKELKPLEKVHYSWPMPLDLLKKPIDPRLYEYARLTHAISLRGESVSAKNIEVAVEVCDSINKKSPEIACSLAVNYSPWHRKFGKDLPPTDSGESHKSEINHFRSKLQFIKKTLAEKNKKMKSDVKLTAILLDSERFHVISENKAKLNTFVSRRHGLITDVKKWNDSITQKHNLIYDEAKLQFPSARIEQYDRGAWMLAASKSGWMQAEWYTLNESGNSFSVSLYRVNEPITTREAFKRTVDSATKHGVDEVTPWVALGSGFRRQVDSFRKWSDWDYDLIYSWQIGAEINVKWYGDRPDRFAPWHKAKVVVFFPSPFAKKYPAWPKHFIAYVRGANKVKNIEDLQ